MMITPPSTPSLSISSPHIKKIYLCRPHVPNLMRLMELIGINGLLMDLILLGWKILRRFWKEVDQVRKILLFRDKQNRKF